MIRSDLWNEIFGTAWQKLTEISPEIGTYIVHHDEKSIEADDNALKLLGLGEILSFEQMNKLFGEVAVQSSLGSPLKLIEFSPRENKDVGILKLTYRAGDNIGSENLCTEDKIISYLSASSSCFLALLQFETDAAEILEFHIFTAISSIVKEIPTALICRRADRRYWLCVPDISGDPVSVLSYLQSNVSKAVEELENSNIRFTFTAGCSKKDGSPEQRMNTAEVTLYEATLRGKGTVLDYSEQQYKDRKNDYDKIKKFSQLVDENLFVYHFQPIVSSHTGEIIAYEALMRTGNDIDMQPLEILQTAEQCNRLYDIERATMLNTLKVIANHREEFSDKKLFVNSISAHMLSDADWIFLENTFGDIMDKMVMELTERTEVSNENLDIIRIRLKNNNIDLAIDDYGTGYSNTSNLLRYKPDYVKIDRSLIEEIHLKPKIQQLVAGIVEFIHSNGFLALAEGVETFDELRTMIRLGCDLIQGFYVATPKPFIISRISENVREEIIQINSELGSEVTRYYHPKNNEIIDIYELSSGRYSSIVVDTERVIVKGSTDAPINMSIIVKDGITTHITLVHAVMANENTNSIVTLGEHSHVTLDLVGSNQFIKRGIYVPESSSLKITGAGNLDIQASSTLCFGIGADRDQSHGDIDICLSGKLEIQSFGDKCVGIGGGWNNGGKRININSGDIRINCEGSESCAIGTLQGGADLFLADCAVSILTNSANSVGIGSLRGAITLTMANFRLELSLSGTKLCGIGVLESGTGSVTGDSGTFTGSFHGRNICCIGTYDGDLDITISHADINVECGGTRVVGIGDYEGKGDTIISNSGLKMLLLTADGKAVGSKDGKTELTETYKQIQTG